MSHAALDTAVQSMPQAAANFSVFNLFLNADWIVQSIMLILIAASFWCWTIIFAKWYRLRQLNAQAHTFEESFWAGGALDVLYDRIGTRPQDPMSAVFASAMREWQRSCTKIPVPTSSLQINGAVQQRIERVMQTTMDREIESIEGHMTFLASVGSTAPFIGLFGTVWGIMHSFQSIAASQSTNLAVVAPGIAEALFATALGLVAAIPAVLAYNKLSNEINRYVGRIDIYSQ